MTQVRMIKVTEAHDGQRLDRWLKRELGRVPQSLIFKIIRTGQVRVDGKRAKADQRVSEGQEVRVPPVKAESKEKKGLSQKDREFIKSLVIYDDGDVIALNKPGNIATQGGTNTYRHIDGLLEGLKNKKGVMPRLVHRLDKETSGVLILARSAAAVRELGFMFKGKDVEKQYCAMVSPTPEVYEGTIDAPLLKAGGKMRENIQVHEDGQKAITDYQVIDNAGKKAALLIFRPQTGRTHQIRVHASQVLEAPIVGDRKYGFDPDGFEGQLGTKRTHLHAFSLSFRHPTTKKHVEIKAPLPLDLKKSWKSFGFNEKLTPVIFEPLK